MRKMPTEKIRQRKRNPLRHNKTQSANPRKRALHFRGHPRLQRPPENSSQLQDRLAHPFLCSAQRYWRTKCSFGRPREY